MNAALYIKTEKGIGRMRFLSWMKYNWWQQNFILKRNSSLIWILN